MLFERISFTEESKTSSSSKIPYSIFTHYFLFLYSDPEDLTIDFNSACAITGKVLAYNRNKVKKNPIVPKKIQISTNVGEYIVHEDGK